MRPTRNHCRTILPLSAALLLCALVIAQSPDPPPQGKATLVYIGAGGDKGKGIHLFRLQSVGTEVSQNVTLVPLGLAAETPNPTFFELDLNRRLLFAVNEIDQFEGKPTGAVSAFSITPTGKLTLINQRPSMGPRPCHLALDGEARNLLATNCGDGSVAVLPIASDGKLGEATDVVKGTRASSVTLDRAGRFAFVCDPAADKVMKYSFDAQAGKLRPATPAFVQVKAGSSPRQMLFRPDGKFAYLLNEKTSLINVYSYDAATGALAEVQTVSTVPESYDGPNTAIEMQAHPTGKWLYVSNTGHDSIVLFTVDGEKGTLTYVEEQGTGGRHARQFGIQPNAMHMAISLPETNQILASRIDAGNGRLKPSGIFAEMPSPATVRFLPPAGGEK
ncbi:MAG TPA: lactonase family protein [Blastocatellia bacterium]|nr:lactonase family protein [Blastocatellia bacterium]